MSRGPILNNGTQSPAEKSNVWHLKKQNMSYKSRMNEFAETKTNEEKDMYEDIRVRKFYHNNEKEREILETLL